MNKLPPTLRLIGIGWYVGGCIIVGVAGGFWLDRWSGLTPLFTIVGLLAGLLAAAWGGYLLLAAALGHRPGRGR